MVDNIYGPLVLTVATYILENQYSDIAFDSNTKYPEERQITPSLTKPAGKVSLAVLKHEDEWKFIILLFSIIETNYKFYISEISEKSQIELDLARQTYEWFEELVAGLEMREEVPSKSLEDRAKDPNVDWFRECLIGLILRDWIEEVPERVIVERYGIELGDLGVIKETGEWLVFSAYIITKTVGLKRHSDKLEVLIERVRHGVREDVLDLVKLKYIGRVRARILANSGIRNIKDSRSVGF
ncbi:MAG: hypothetical protein QW836_09875 [Ignisphaera sp.]